MEKKKKAQDPSPQKKNRDEKKRRDEYQKAADKKSKKELQKLEEHMEEQRTEFKNLSTYDDVQTSTNPLCRRLIELKTSAERLDLTELATYLEEAVCSLGHDDVAHLKFQQLHLDAVTLHKRKKGGRQIQMTREEFIDERMDGVH